MSLLDDRAAHEGWDSANDWQGFLPHELLPQVINPEQGWLVSANHRPIASFYPSRWASRPAASATPTAPGD